MKNLEQARIQKIKFGSAQVNLRGGIPLIFYRLKWFIWGKSRLLARREEKRVFDGQGIDRPKIWNESNKFKTLIKNLFWRCHDYGSNNSILKIFKKWF